MEKRKDKNLAEGEVTGHAHRCNSDTATVFGEGAARLLVCPDGTEVTHEEHKTIDIPPGEYDITIQREIDPDTEEARTVAD